MKVCESCGVLCQDDAVKCESCGGVYFKYRCNNCGTDFKDGLFCPKCGTRAGQEARICPRCKTEYFTNACPTCGYIPGNNTQQPTYQVIHHTNNYTPKTSSPPKKSHIGWWILGWLLCPPIPISILLWRGLKLKKPVKVAIIAAVWIVFATLLSIKAANDGGFNRGSSGSSSTSQTETAATEETPTGNAKSCILFEHIQ